MVKRINPATRVFILGSHRTWENLQLPEIHLLKLQIPSVARPGRPMPVWQDAPASGVSDCCSWTELVEEPGLTGLLSWVVLSTGIEIRRVSAAAAPSDD